MGRSGTQPKDLRKIDYDEDYVFYSGPMYTSLYTSLQYSDRLRVLISFLFAGAIHSLLEIILPAYITASYNTNTEWLMLFPVWAIVFIVITKLGMWKWHQYVVHPLLCALLGYSYASILKQILSINMDLYVFTAIIAVGFLLFSFTTCKVYSLPMYLFNACTSLACSFYLVFLIMSILVVLGTVPAETSYSGLYVFLAFLFHFIVGFRHRFKIVEGLLAFVVSFCSTYFIYILLGREFTVAALMHTLTGGFIFTACFGILVSFAARNCFQPKAKLFYPGPIQREYTDYDHGYDHGHSEGDSSGYDRGYEEGRRAAERDYDY
ncbi:hypothetical protein [Bacillus hominis]|uniref:hypothetical protein n=1 Tax=Bacillus hominis TaxID=2817478 RepID=UPI001BB2FCFE|nr:hypothetical protein [Bacillus hominis]